MRFKGTSALFIVFLALGLFVYFTEFRNREARQQEEEAKKKAIQVDEKSIQEVSLIYPGLTITAQRKGATDWEMTSPPGVEADAEGWNQIVSNIPRIEREETVATDVSDLKPFGLDAPLTRVVAKTSAGKQFELLFGNENPRKIHNYAKFADSTEVFLTPNSWPRLFQKTVDDLRNKKLLAFEADSIDAVRIEDGPNQLELQKSGMDWMLRKPIQSKADSGEATTFISAIEFARAQSFAGPSIRLEDTGLNQGAIRITLHDARANSDKVLLIGKQVEAGKYYARDAARDVIFIVDQDIAGKARRPVFDWRDKTIARLERDKIDEVEIQQASGNLLLRKAGADWQLMDGRKLAADKVSSMLNTVEFEKAQEIVDAPSALSAYGLDKPRLQVRFLQGTTELLHIAFGSDRNADAVYIKTSADPAVRAVSKDFFDKFNVKAEDLVASPSTSQ